MTCIFCKLVAGVSPCDQLYEDDLVLAFLDIAPINPGHTLVIPKDHHHSITTVPEAVLGRMMSVANRLGPALVRVTEGDGFNYHLANGDAAGQTVNHAHLHVIPRFGTDGFAWGWRSLPFADSAARETLICGVRKRLERRAT
jgi:histidine triad (HIT) family protein